MRAAFDLLSQIPSAPRAVGVVSPFDLAAQPALAANISFARLLAGQLGPIASQTGESPPEASSLALASIELGVDPALAPVLPDAPASATDVPEAERRVDDSALALAMATPPIPAGPLAGLTASAAGAQPRATSVESESAGTGDPQAPAAAVRRGTSLRSAIAGAAEQAADVVLDSPRAAARPALRSAIAGAAEQAANVVLDGPRAAARPAPSVTPPPPTEPPATFGPNPKSVIASDPRSVAQGLALPPESTVPSLRLDPTGNGPSAARLREDSPGSAGPRRVQQEALSPPRHAPNALATPEPSPRESERVLLPGVPDRDQPESARALGTSPGQVAIRESATPPVLVSSERTAPPASPTPGTAVVQQVEWLAEQGGGTARMRLSPASLGEIEVEVKLQQGRVLVLVRAREHAGQQALLAERSAVMQLFGARDLKVSDFVVTPLDGGSAAGNADANAGGATTQGHEQRSGAGDRTPVGTPAAFTPGTAVDRRSADIGTNEQSGRLDVRV